MKIDCNKSTSVMQITMEGEVVTHFFKNRIGVCLLNPLQGCVGMPCVVNGTNAHFPDTISLLFLSTINECIFLQTGFFFFLFFVFVCLL
jgi:hypothetical protein